MIPIDSIHCKLLETIYKSLYNCWIIIYNIYRIIGHEEYKNEGFKKICNN